MKELKSRASTINRHMNKKADSKSYHQKFSFDDFKKRFRLRVLKAGKDISFKSTQQDHKKSYLRVYGLVKQFNKRQHEEDRRGFHAVSQATWKMMLNVAKKLNSKPGKESTLQLLEDIEREFDEVPTTRAPAGTKVREIEAGKLDMVQMGVMLLIGIEAGLYVDDSGQKVDVTRIAEFISRFRKLTIEEYSQKRFQVEQKIQIAVTENSRT